MVQFTSTLLWMHDLCSFSYDLQVLIESACEKLSKFKYDGGDVGAEMVNRQRDSVVPLRSCSWASLAAEVEEVIRAKQRLDDPSASLITVSEATIRHYCAARRARSLIARRHNPIADVGVHKLQGEADVFNIDAPFSHAMVREFEDIFFELLDLNVPAVLRCWDDHAKWKADKKQAFTRCSTVTLKQEVKKAPYSDMQVVLGGAVAVTNSIMLCLPVDTDAAFGGGGVSQKRSKPCVKQAYAVIRLERERRSTPTQQLNDWNMVVETHRPLKEYMEKCTVKMSISDGGFDHNAGNSEVQYVQTKDHLCSDRNYDADYQRAAGLSSFNEAERVNAAETKAVAKADVPSLLALGPPSNSADLQRNRRGFQMAMTSAIAGGIYGKRAIVSYASYDQVPDSELTSDAERFAARAIIAAKPENRLTLPMVRAVCPVLRYADLHGKREKLAFQLSREACSMPSRLGRLCTRTDYAPFDDKLPFKPCDERVWRGMRLPFVFVPMPTMGEDGHYRRGGDRGDIDPELVIEPPSVELKRYYKMESTHPSPSEEVYVFQYRLI